MKIRIIEPGWGGYTGAFGGVPFEDGISTREVTPLEAARVANIVQVESDEGTNPSSSQEVIDTQGVSMSELMVSEAHVEATKRPEVKVYTREELSGIADKEGIAGVRRIADALGLKSNSMAKLIELILNAQRQDAPESTPLTADDVLLGSGVQPAEFIIDGKVLPLGDLVRAAQQASGKTPAEWNDLVGDERERLIAEQVGKLKSA